MTDGRINISSTALIIADFYKDMMGTIPHSIERNVLGNTQKLQKAARQSGMLICYSATVFRPGYIEISDRNKTFSQRKKLWSASGVRSN